MMRGLGCAGARVPGAPCDHLERGLWLVVTWRSNPRPLQPFQTQLQRRAACSTCCWWQRRRQSIRCPCTTWPWSLAPRCPASEKESKLPANPSQPVTMTDSWSLEVMFQVWEDRLQPMPPCPDRGGLCLHHPESCPSSYLHRMWRSPRVKEKFP
ncbi:Breakpoint cluster region protein [Plecturocebus cupreus]